MKYHFAKEHSFFLFQDAFIYFLKDKGDPFRHLIHSRFSSSNEHEASYCIGQAHQSVFLETFRAPLRTPLAKKERELCKQAFVEMNVAIFSYQIENHEISQDFRLEKQIREHVRLFPCSFNRKGESHLEIGPEHEAALDTIVSFLEMLLVWDANSLASFLGERYEGLDVPFVAERLDFLGKYYEADGFAKSIYETVTEARREAEQ